MSLKATARNLMRILGSENFGRFGWRDTWGLVVQKKGKMYAEGFQKTKSLNTWAEPVSFEVTVPLQSVDESECHWEDTEVNKRRKDFCSKYEGYGSICSCKYLKNCFPSWKHMQCRIFHLCDGQIVQKLMNNS